MKTSGKKKNIVVIWEFRVKKEKRRQFEDAYGPNGVWAKFFRAGKGYVGTVLVRDIKIAGRYLTLDYWASESAYEKFRSSNKTRYREIDKDCGSLTTRETKIGWFA